MSKTETKQYIQKRFDKVNDEMAEDVSREDYFKLKGQLTEIENFASNFGVKINRRYVNR